MGENITTTWLQGFAMKHIISIVKDSQGWPLLEHELLRIDLLILSLSFSQWSTSKTNGPTPQLLAFSDRLNQEHSSKDTENQFVASLKKLLQYPASYENPKWMSQAILDGNEDLLATLLSNLRLFGHRLKRWLDAISNHFFENNSSDWHYLLDQILMFHAQKDRYQVIPPTPSSIVRLMLETLSVKENSAILDPWSRAGEFLYGLPLNSEIVAQTPTNLNRWLVALSMLMQNQKRAKISLSNLTSENDVFYSEKFDYILCNPPFAMLLHENRMKRGLNSEWTSKFQSTQSEIFFLTQSIDSLAPKGKMAFIVPMGVMIGEKAKKLRKEMVETGFLRALTFLPKGSFSVSNVATSILFFEKEETQRPILVADFRALDGKGEQTWENHSSIKEFCKLALNEQHIESPTHENIYWLERADVLANPSLRIDKESQWLPSDNKTKSLEVLTDEYDSLFTEFINVRSEAKKING